MAGLQINNVVSLNEGTNPDQMTIKPEPVDEGYDAAFAGTTDESASDTAAAVTYNGSKNATDITFPSGESSNRLRGILSNMLSDTSKELSVKTVIEDLLQKNEYLLAQNNAGLYKPQARNMSCKKDTYCDSPRSESQTSSASVYNINNASPAPKPAQGAILRPGSPTLTCPQPKKDNTLLSLLELGVLDTQTEQTLSNTTQEVVCGVASKAFIMTQEGVNIQTDLQFYWCNFCPFKTDSKQNLLGHVMEHRFHCKTCDYQSFSRADVIRHAVQEHSDFYETAKTLKFCSFLLDFEEKTDHSTKKSSKRKVDEGNKAAVKKAKVDSDRESTGITKKTSEVKEKTSEVKEKTKKSQKKDDEYECFEMEVDEVDDDNDNYESEDEEEEEENEERSTETIITPSSKKEISKALPISVPTLLKQPQLTSVKIPTPPSSNSNISATLSTKASSPLSSKAGNTVTVSSGLCWNCGYCEFVTLSQTFLKTHLNSQHTGKAHKYVAMLVSSQEEMNRIKEKDSTMYQSPNTAVYGNLGNQSSSSSFTPSTPTSIPPASMATPGTDSAGIPERENAEYEDSESDEDFIPAEQKKKYPLTYKCAHCNFNAPVCFKIKEHLQIKHVGCVLYSLDMRAVKLKQRRYVFFCHRKNCSFTTKKTEEYLNHSESCTPWLENGCPEKVDAPAKKCLELTRSFSSKISQKAFQMAKNFKSSKSAEYACVHCSYTSNNNTRVKKHVLSNHKDSDTLMKDLQAHRMKKKMYVYFCKYCLWETRNDGELTDHLKDKHNDSSVVNPAPYASEDEPPMMMEMPATSSLVVNSPTVSIEMDESPPTTTPEESANNSDAGEYDDNFDDLEVPQDVIQSLMDEYVTHEASHGMSPGRPTRNAAAKAQVRCRAQGQSPQLFRCIHCPHMCFGVNLVKKHMKARHSSEPLRSMDLKKKIARSYAYYCFCPKEGCTFSHTSEESVIKHACNDHGFSPENEELQQLNQPTIRGGGSGGGPVRHDVQYECLYCNTNGTSAIKTSMEKMRRHILEDHGGEEVIFRDCVARKLRKTSRIFMCAHLTCGYNTTDQKEYTLHRLAHEKSHIYECAKCQWFTANPDTVASHMSAMHTGSQVTTMEIFLDLDEKGNVVKKVGGTVIKQEPE
ncbi:uncharacterized protein LOC110442815 [Mizuhopecten yessoensis]|uniref:C2H2-type domain-containing protein n=1 Tax=Mizuhopecten yessoensis TaxID=6573 RepID=A0A210PGG3_MIZYE|nr:uncharacterized protein LOC110442815 [Mizuhopecten yessoensis]OWF35551.1 hypothetical protein KP79_PYT08402 [Mizuhopecten yessoensis]